MCVCVCVCHRGYCKALSRYRLVGSCVRPGENFFPKPTTFARLTQSRAISQSLAFSSLYIRSMREKNKFHFFTFFETLFYTVSFTMAITRSPGGEFAGGGQSTSKSTCVVPTRSLTAFGDRPASSRRLRLCHLIRINRVLILIKQLRFC